MVFVKVGQKSTTKIVDDSQTCKKFSEPKYQDPLGDCASACKVVTVHPKHVKFMRGEGAN